MGGRHALESYVDEAVSNATGAWEVLAEVDVASATDAVDIDSLPERREFRLLARVVVGGGSNRFVRLRFNGDDGDNYTRQILTVDGSSASAVRATSQSSLMVMPGNADSGQVTFTETIITQGTASQRKQAAMTTAVGKHGASTLFRVEGAVWENTSALISEMNLIAGASNAIGAGSRFVLLGRG